MTFIFNSDRREVWLLALLLLFSFLHVKGFFEKIRYPLHLVSLIYVLLIESSSTDSCWFRRWFGCLGTVGLCHNANTFELIERPLDRWDANSSKGWHLIVLEGFIKRWDWHVLGRFFIWFQTCHWFKVSVFHLFKPGFLRLELLQFGLFASSSNCELDGFLRRCILFRSTSGLEHLAALHNPLRWRLSCLRLEHRL